MRILWPTLAAAVSLLSSACGLPDAVDADPTSATQARLEEGSRGCTVTPVWVVNSADRVFSTSVRPDQALSCIQLHAARGELEAAQIVLRNNAALTGVRVTVTDLQGPNGATLPASLITVRREYNHPRIDKPAGDVEQPPGGGTAYYDALVDNVAVTVPANTTQPYHYQVAVPRNQTPGRYVGSATVVRSDGNVTVPVSLTVYPVTLPAGNESGFKMVNWHSGVGIDVGMEEAIPKQFGVKLYDANWWKVIENLAKNLARHRSNVVYVDVPSLLIPNTTVNANGTFTFGWETFDRFVQTFIDAGTGQYIYSSVHLEPFETPRYRSLRMLRVVNGKLQRVSVPANTPESNAYLDQVLPALKAHLDAKGWTNRFYMSGMDEPHAGEGVATPWLYSKIAQHFPGAKTTEAHLYLFPETEPSLTALTPLVSLYGGNPAHYQRHRLAGKELWLYNCIVPQGDDLNRFISYHLSKARLTPWLLWKIGGNGYLHWGWNFWYTGTIDKPADTFNDPQTGDFWIVSPNKAALDFYDSLRSEAVTDGQEDYELLVLLAQTKPALARALAESLMVGTTVFEKSGVELDARHRQLLEALSQPESDAAFTFDDDFAGDASAWRTRAGTWAVSNGAYVQSQRVGAVAALEARGYADFAASVELQLTGAVDANGWAGVVLRNMNGTDADTGYLVGLRQRGEVFVSRAGTVLGTAPIPALGANERVRLRVVFVGDKLSVFVRGAPALTVQDAAFSAGGFALATGNASALFDNVRLNPLTLPLEAATVSASSTSNAAGFSTLAAADGLRGEVAGALGWSSAEGTLAARQEWIRFDLPRASEISRVDLYPASSGFPVDFVIETSLDGSQWKEMARRTGYPAPAAEPQAFAFETVEAKHVRVTGTRLAADANGQYRMAFAEVEAVGTNLAAGRAVTSSSSFDNAAAGLLRKNLTDGVRTSHWRYSVGWSSAYGAADRSEWVAVDLGGQSRFSEVALFARSDGNFTGDAFPSQLKVEVSSDAASWTQVAARNDQPVPDASAQRFTFAPVTARYVRVTADKLRPDIYGDPLFQLAELEVRSPLVKSPQPSGETGGETGEGGGEKPGMVDPLDEVRGCGCEAAGLAQSGALLLAALLLARARRRA